MKKYVLATANPGKVSEMQQILSKLNIECVTRNELGIDMVIEETGTTFFENAKLKAEAICAATGLPAIADDSGLIVEALGGEPGVYSSSYGGETLTSEQRCKFLLEKMQKMEQRRAKFVCNIICAFPDGSFFSATGECLGHITSTQTGNNGFGYDPVFQPDGYNVSMAEITSEQKNLISHRGKALRKFSELLKLNENSASKTTVTNHQYLTHFNMTSETGNSRYKRIGIFGGSFNPPHKGHVKAVQKAAKENNLDLLIVVPTGTPPHKPLPPDTPSPAMRLTMTMNAFIKTPNVIVSDIEIFSTDSNYSIDTVKEIKRQHPNSDLFLLVGTDMYETLDTWKDSHELLTLITPIQMSREDVKISSTELRDMLIARSGLPYIADSNYSLLIKNRLYGAKPNWNWLRKRAHSMLDPLRISHVEACEQEAVRLAERWSADIDEAREAAILHDITKKLDFTENMRIITLSELSVSSVENGSEKLLHQITGSLLAKTEFGVSYAVSDAIRWHTTGRANMSLLEKIIYIADYIEATRDFPGVNELREKAYTNIDEAVVMGLEMTVDDLLSRGIEPSQDTNEALNHLKR